MEPPSNVEDYSGVKRRDPMAGRAKGALTAMGKVTTALKPATCGDTGHLPVCRLAVVAQGGRIATP
jgi:hypothetical protein